MRNEMKTELEARYYAVDVAAIEVYLEQSGAVWGGELQMNRIVYDIDPVKRKFLRLRRESQVTAGTVETTITLKEINNVSSMAGTLEHEIRLKGDQFVELSCMLEAIGLKQKSYQESRRRQWHYKNSTIFIDCWPGLKPLVEIESNSEEVIRAMAHELQLPTRFEGDIVALYCREMGISREEFHKIKRLVF